MNRPRPFPLRPQDIRLRRDLLASGWHDRDIARMMAAGEIHRVRYGAYADARVLAGLDAVGAHRARARAVLRAGHPSLVLTHASAVAEYDVPLWRLSLDEVSVTRVDGVAGRREAGVRRHSGWLPLEHMTVRHEVPISTAARAAVEILTVADLELGLVILNGLLHAGHTTLDEVRGVAAHANHWPETLAVRLALGLADQRLSSVGETRFAYLCHRQSIPMPTPQVEVRDEHGHLLGIVDFLWRMYGIFLEFDGAMKYQLFRRDNEALDQYLMREKRREESICRVTGWICVRIGWADLERPVETARRIMALIDRRRTWAA